MSDEQETMVLRTVYLPKSLDLALRTYAFKHEITKGAVIRMAVEAMIGQMSTTPVKTFDHQDPLDIVRHFALTIQNGRTMVDAVRHANSEMAELEEEIARKQLGEEAGPDGIVGEAIDVIACALDIIFLEAPETTNQQINEILLRKCEKWARRYGNSVDGDRTID